MTFVKMAEMLGESSHSWNDAVQQAIREASRDVRNITGVEVYNLTAGVESGRITEYKANVKIAYTE